MLSNLKNLTAFRFIINLNLVAMKKFLVFIQFVLFSTTFSFAQGIHYGYNSPEITSLQKGPLYIISTGDKAFDDSLKAAVDLYWKICPVKHVSFTEATSLVEDKNNIFMTSMVGDKFSTIKAPSKGGDRIIIFVGGEKLKKDGSIFIGLPIASTSIDLFFEKKHTNSSLRLIIKSINDLASILITEKVEKGISLSDKEAIAFFNKKTPVLKDKILLVDELASRAFAKEKVLKKYKYQYEIVPAAEIINRMKSSPKKYCYLSDHIIGGEVVNIYDFETNSLIFHGPGKMTGGPLNDTQIQLLNSAVDKK